MPQIRPIKDSRNIKLDLYQKLAEAEVQIKNGEELLDGEEVFRKLREKHGTTNRGVK